MPTIKEVLKTGAYGLYFGNRVLLPFRCHILKVIFENEIITDFSSSKKGACYKMMENFTEIYFHEVKDLGEAVSKYKGVKMIVVQEGKNIFDFKNHEKLNVFIGEDHKLKIEKVEDDILFFE
jgi:hypothetical protein